MGQGKEPKEEKRQKKVLTREGERGNLDRLTKEQ